MSTPRSTKRVHSQVTATTSTTVTALTGPLLLAYGATTLRISGFGSNFRGNLNIRPRLRKFAVRPDAPEDAPFTEGTIVATAMSFSEDFSLASLGSFLWVQPCIGASVSSGAGGFVAFRASTDSTAMIVARQTVVLGPDINSSQTAFVPLGKPFPALTLSGVMVAISARGIIGSPQVNFVKRTFEGDPSIPTDWDATALLGTNKTFSTLNEDYNSGNLALTAADVGWAQIGLKLPSGNFYGTLDIIVAAKY